jgi:hypothetical protein
MNSIQKISLILVLILGFVVRLYKIDNPIADWHSWRQADTSAVTRNFIKFGINPFLPRYDDFGDASQKGLLNPSGFRMVEFPFYNILHFVTAKLLPTKNLEFAGRLTTILISMASGVFLFALVRRHINNTWTGLVAMAIFYFLPFNIYFSRVILPDPLMVALVLAALNLVDLGRVFPAALFAAVAILVKPVAVFFLLPIIFSLRKQLFKPANLWAGAIVLLPILVWRMWIAKFPEGIPNFIWLLNANKIRFKGAFFRWIFGERIGNLILGNWGIFPLASGVLNLPGMYFATWIIAALAYMVVVATGNVHHDYYQIPIIPVISVLVAIGISSTWKIGWVARGLVVIIVLFMFGFSWYHIKGNYQVNNPSILYAGEAARRLLPKDAVIVAPYNGDVAFLYQTDRRGFAYMPLPIEELKQLYGVSYLVSVNYDDDTNRIMKNHTIIERTSDYVIVKIDEPQVDQ